MIDTQSQIPKVLMIDNYDSFTWNLYQYLCLIGANVTVIRSQSCSIEDLIKSYPDITHLVISPGPGHPTTDSGISIPALIHFSGKIPILGICMGLQCIYTAFGGLVTNAGEIVHGKTSRINHDRSGLFTGLKQGIQSTRYHSLAGQLGSLPSELSITSWTTVQNDNDQVSGDIPKPFDSQSSIIMGIRHKKFSIEAVQYHPESILSEEGKPLLANFLNLRGGLWSENPAFDPSRIKSNENLTQSNNSLSSKPNPAPSSPSDSKLPTILEKICNQRIIDVQEAKKVPGGSPSDLRRKLAANVPPTQIDFYERVNQDRNRPNQKIALMAEIKRASPSKGSFVTDSTPTPPEIAISYARAGASVISVLTEPTWFKGTLLDMLQVRLAVENIPNRPAILRKDFILDPYQIDEARCFGADTVLLIVACLSDEKLEVLFKHSKKLGMEPLVEVNNADELTRALSLGARVIGVNNRNLHDFNVDMQTTTHMVNAFKDRANQTGGSSKEVIMCALSGISCRADVERYTNEGVGAVLVGESMMKPQNKSKFVRDLLGKSEDSSEGPRTKTSETMVKICGIRTPEEAIHAARCGADLIGLIFVSKSKRYVSPTRANEIIRSVQRWKGENLSPRATGEAEVRNFLDQKDWFSLQSSRLSSIPISKKPLFVGIFQDSSLDDIQTVLNSMGSSSLDLIQLHGKEPIGMSKFLSLPVIRTFHVPIVEESRSQINGNYSSNDNDDDVDLIYDNDCKEIFRSGYHVLPLIDSKSLTQTGGTRKTFDWKNSKILKHLKKHQNNDGEAEDRKNLMILAGGLNVQNVSEGIKIFNPLIVDVSGGVEIDGFDKDEKFQNGDQEFVGRKDFKKVEEFIRVVKNH